MRRLSLLVLAALVAVAWAAQEESLAPLDSMSCLQMPTVESQPQFQAVFIRNDGVIAERKGGDLSDAGKRSLHTQVTVKRKLGAGRNAVAYEAAINTEEETGNFEGRINVYFRDRRADKFAKFAKLNINLLVKNGRRLMFVPGIENPIELNCDGKLSVHTSKHDGRSGGVLDGLANRSLYNFVCTSEDGAEELLPYDFIPKVRQIEIGLSIENFVGILRGFVGDHSPSLNFARGSSVVIKPFSDASDPEFKFISRVGSGAHPNVLRMYGYLIPQDGQLLGSDHAERYTADLDIKNGRVPNKCFWIVMEFWGGSLESYITNKFDTGISEEIRNSLMSQVLDAVSFLSSQRILHRDLKPDNFLVKDGDDGKPHVKMMDFGLSIDIDNDLTPMLPVGLANWRDAVRPPESGAMGTDAVWPYGRVPVWSLDIWGVGMMGVMFGEQNTKLGVRADEIVRASIPRRTGCFSNYLTDRTANALMKQPGGERFAATIRAALHPMYYLRASPEELRQYFIDDKREGLFSLVTGSGSGGDVAFSRMRDLLYPSVGNFVLRNCRPTSIRTRTSLPFANCANSDDQCSYPVSDCPTSACVRDICDYKVSLDVSGVREATGREDNSISCSEILRHGMHGEHDPESTEQIPVSCVEGQVNTVSSCALVHFCLTECNREKLMVLKRVTSGNEDEPSMDDAASTGADGIDAVKKEDDDLINTSDDRLPHIDAYKTPVIQPYADEEDAMSGKNLEDDLSGDDMPSPASQFSESGSESLPEAEPELSGVVSGEDITDGWKVSGSSFEEAEY